MAEQTTEIEIRKDSVALDDFVHRHTKNEIPIIYDKICEGCMVPRYTIQNWLRGLARIPELHKCKIEEIFGETIFDKLETCEK